MATTMFVGLHPEPCTMLMVQKLITSCVLY